MVISVWKVAICQGAGAASIAVSTRRELIMSGSSKEMVVKNLFLLYLFGCFKCDFTGGKITDMTGTFSKI
jgi:hypothetical protein